MTSDEAAASAQSGTASGFGPLPFDTSTAHQARMYDYLLGGKDNISQEVRAYFRNRDLTWVIAGQARLIEKRHIARSPTFMHHYIP